jgi:hypothetical protein
MFATAVRKFTEMADVGIALLDRHHLMCEQWLSRQRSRSTDPNPFERPAAIFARKHPRSIDSYPLDDFACAEPSGTRIPFVIPLSLPSRDMVTCDNRRLDGIMTVFPPSSHEYDLSDWEDDATMKAVELDLDSPASDAKLFPDWATAPYLTTAVARQNPSAWDMLFEHMAR